MRAFLYRGASLRKAFVVLCIIMAELTVLSACTAKDTASKKQISSFAPRIYVLDEETDSVFYRGMWYYNAHSDFSDDWESKTGDHLMRHIIMCEDSWTLSKSLILAENGDTIACPGDSITMHYDKYGDTIFFKRNNIYF